LRPIAASNAEQVLPFIRHVIDCSSGIELRSAQPPIDVDTQEP
jgi:hypothetical protein